jgi:histidinol dehydrogenase
MTSALPLTVRRLDSAAPGFDAELSALIAFDAAQDPAVDAAVAKIVADVRLRGDAALLDYTAQFDRLPAPSVAALEIPAAELAAAFAGLPEQQRDALQAAAARIRSFHERQPITSWTYRDDTGCELGQQVTALDRVGIYVPGGKAAYPSSVLMNAIPARVAGVGEIIMVVPTPDGVRNALVLAAAHVAGVGRVFTIGGAQAVAALAYGTATIAPVDKIVGPGNAYVAAAKRRVFGRVGIDMIAGPSEILVVADAANDPSWIAADLLSQAEHDTAAQSILIANAPPFADAVAAAVERMLAELPRRAIAGESWRRHGAIIVVRDFVEAVPLIDRLAPEHCELALEDADALAAQIRNAGALFLGRYTPEAVGDYVGGPNHVLPTARSARFSSGLGVLDFLKRTSLLACDAAALAAIGPAAVTLARAEGLDAHAESVAVRLNMPRH